MEKDLNFVKIKMPLEIYNLSHFLVEGQKDYPVGSIVLTKFKKSPRYITKKGHYTYLYRKDLLEENIVGMPEKHFYNFWVRIK